MTTATSVYEQRAWEKLIEAEISRRNSLLTRAVNKVSRVVSTAVTIAGDAVKVPGGEVVTSGMDAAIRTAFNAAAQGVFKPAITSVSVEQRARRSSKALTS